MVIEAMAVPEEREASGAVRSAEQHVPRKLAGWSRPGKPQKARGSHFTPEEPIVAAALVGAPIRPSHLMQDEAETPVGSIDHVTILLKIDSDWKVPSIDCQAPVKLQLVLQNTGEQRKCFCVMDTISVCMYTKDGERVPVKDAGRKADRARPNVTPWLGKEETFTVDHFSAKLVRDSNGLRLEGEDGYGGRWFVENLKPGRYKLALVFESRDKLTTADGRTVWNGKVRTKVADIEVK